MSGTTVATSEWRSALMDMCEGIVQVERVAVGEIRRPVRAIGCSSIPRCGMGVHEPAIECLHTQSIRMPWSVVWWVGRHVNMTATMWTEGVEAMIVAVSARCLSSSTQ